MFEKPLRLATRGSPLAMVQTESILARCRAAFPGARFEIKVIKTTGDRLRKASMARPSSSLPKGLFTKELESALLEGQADLAVHSLKDLPTELPEGLELGAVTERADARDVLILRAADAEDAGDDPHDRRAGLSLLAEGVTVATSSTRRAEQLRAARPDLKTVEIRGNVGTRLRKVAESPEFGATLLAAAGLLRLGFHIDAGGGFRGPRPDAVPAGLAAFPLAPEVMLPAPGQAAIGLEARAGDELARRVCGALNDARTLQCVSAERSLLQAMGGGCQSPVAAFAIVRSGQLWLRAVSFQDGQARCGDLRGPPDEAAALGRRLADRLR